MASRMVATCSPCRALRREYLRSTTQGARLGAGGGRACSHADPAPAGWLGSLVQQSKTHERRRRRQVGSL